MRIVAGLHRGRQLTAPLGDTTRPTADRVRQALFNILLHAAWNDRHPLENATVLDVFAGTGALGLEALSQGAQHAVFIEKDRKVASFCQRNIEALKEAPRATVLIADALHPPSCPQHLAPRSLVFLDPPYHQGWGAQALIALKTQGWLTTDATIVMEMSKKTPDPLPADVQVLTERVYGHTLVRFLQIIS